MKIIGTHCYVLVEDAEGNKTTFKADAPTIEMCIEKLGAIERKVERENKLEAQKEFELALKQN